MKQSPSGQTQRKQGHKRGQKNDTCRALVCSTGPAHCNDRRRKTQKRRRRRRNWWGIFVWCLLPVQPSSRRGNLQNTGHHRPWYLPCLSAADTPIIPRRNRPVSAWTKTRLDQIPHQFGRNSPTLGHASLTMGDGDTTRS